MRHHRTYQSVAVLAAVAVVAASHLFKGHQHPYQSVAAVAAVAVSNLLYKD